LHGGIIDKVTYVLFTSLSSSGTTQVDAASIRMLLTTVYTRICQLV